MVPKIDDEVYVLSIIKIYSYFSFVFSVVSKKTELFTLFTLFKFYEVALIFFHCNCLIGCIKTARGYRP